MSQTVIELRQADSQTVRQGEYICNVPHLQVFPGDQIGMRAAFLDTRATGGIVRVESDTTVTFQCICWVQDHDTLAPNYGVPGHKGSSELFIGCKGSTEPAGNLELITEIEFQTDTYHPEPAWGGLYCDFTYTNARNEPDRISILIPAEPGPSERPRIDPGVVCVKGTWYMAPGEAARIARDGNARYSGVKGTAPVQTGGMVETKFNQVITVPAGDYDPSTLGKILSQLLSASNTGPGTFSADPVKSNFLHFSTDFQRFLSSESNPEGETNDFDFKVNTWVGASEIAVEWLPDEARYQFSFLHTPLQSTGSPEARYVEYDTSVLHWVATAHSGIAFTGISSDPPGFMELLGFDLSDILCRVVHVPNIDTGIIINSFAPRVQLRFGQNVVGAYPGLALAIVPGAAYATATFPTAPIQTDVTTPLRARNSALLTGTQSHLLVEVDGLSPTHTVGAGRTSNSIRGVVGKFESYGSFSSAGEEASISVISTSQPYVISNVRVRVLAPDGTPADVGDGNCIYLTLDTSGRRIDDTSGAARVPRSGGKDRPRKTKRLRRLSRRSRR